MFFWGVLPSKYSGSVTVQNAAQLSGREVVLSERHTEILWADPKTFEAEKYFTGGWLKGVQEYQNLKKKGG